MAIGSIGRWIGNPISPPQEATSRSKGGRLLYYEAVEIGETLQHVVQVGDIVEIAHMTQKRSARVNDRIKDDQPFLAQVECMWEDNFTGMKRLRARWLLREDEVRRVLKRRLPRCSSRPRDTAPGSGSAEGVSEAKAMARSTSPVVTAGEDTPRFEGTEVFLTPVADEVDLRAVIGLARVSAGAGVTPALPSKLPGAACDSARRVPRENALPAPNGECYGDVGVASDALTLRRVFDPFACELRVLEEEDVALIRLHDRRVIGGEKSVARDETLGRGNERARASRSGEGSRVRNLGVSSRSSAVNLGGRFNAERTGLSSLELDDVDAGCAASEEDSEGSCSSDVNDDFVLPCKRQRKSTVPSTPTRGQKRSKSLPPRPRGDRGAAAEAGATLQRPRRLAMPPESVRGRIWSVGGSVSGSHRDTTPVVQASSVAGGTEVPVTAGKGRLMVDVGLNEEKSSGSRSKILPSHTPVGRDHQADIPEMLTPDEREAEHCGDERNKRGGVLVWGSTRNRTPKEIERLEGVLSEAKSIQQQNQVKRGVPALLFLGVSGGKRPKRRMAWGVISSGKVDASGNVRAGCSEKEILDVPTTAIQPVQVDEETLRALFQTKGGLANLNEPPKACASGICQGSSNAVWTFAQVRALEDGINRALEDAKSRGDYELVDPEDFFDLNEVSKCVPGKSREEVTSFFMRFMAVSKPLTEVLGGAEATRMRRERIAARLRCQPAQNAASSRPPLPTLRHRPSLRQPPRLLHQMEANEPANLPLALRKTRREAAVKGCRKAASLAGRGISASESDGGTGSDAGEPPIARRRHERDPCTAGGSNKQGGKPAAATGGSDSDEEGVDVGGGDEGGGGGKGEGGGGRSDGGVGARCGVDVCPASRRRQETGGRRPETRGEPKHGNGGRGGDSLDNCLAEDDAGFDEQFGAKGMDVRDSRSFQGEWEPSWERKVGDWGSSGDPQYRDGYVDLRSLEHHSLESDVYDLGALGRDQHRSQQRRRPTQARDTTTRKFRSAEASSGLHGRRGNRVPLSENNGYGMETVGATRFKAGFPGENVRPRHDHEPAQPPERYLSEYGSRAQVPSDLHDHAYGVGSSSWSVQPHARRHRGLPNSSASRADCSAVAGGSGGRVGVGYSRAARNAALGIQGCSQRSASPMASCWFLLDEAQKYLDTARVRYLEGLLATHERQRMTYAQLVERAESCLHDKPQILESFMRIFRSMDCMAPGQAFRREAHNLSREAVDHSRFPDDGVASSSSSSSRCWVDGGYQTNSVLRSELFHDGLDNRRASGSAMISEGYARTSAPVSGSGGGRGRSSGAFPEAPLVGEDAGIRLENGRTLYSLSVEDRMAISDVGARDVSSSRWHAVDGARAMSRGNPAAFRAAKVRSTVETEGEAPGTSMGAGCLWARGIQRTSPGRVLPPSSSEGVSLGPSKGHDGEGAGSSFRLWERRRKTHGDPEAVATNVPATLCDVEEGGAHSGRAAVDVFRKLEPPSLSTSTSPTLATDVFDGHRVSSTVAKDLRVMGRPEDDGCAMGVSGSAATVVDKLMSTPASSNEKNARRTRLFELNSGDDSGAGPTSILSVPSETTVVMRTTMATSRLPQMAEERPAVMSSASIPVSHGVAQPGTTRGEVQASLSPRGLSSAASTLDASSSLCPVIPRSSATAPVAIPGAARTDVPTRALRLSPPTSPRTSTLSAAIPVAISGPAISTSTAPCSLSVKRGGAEERASVAGVVPGPTSPTAEVVPAYLSATDFTPAAVSGAFNMDDEGDAAAHAAAEGNRRGVSGPLIPKTSPEISYAASRTSSAVLQSDETVSIAQGPAREVSPPALTAAAKVQSFSTPTTDDLGVDYTASRWSCFGNTESSPPAATTDMRNSFGNVPPSSYVPGRFAHPRSVKGGVIREVAPIRRGGSPASSVASSASSGSLSAVRFTPRPATAGFPTSPLEVFATSAPSEMASSGDASSRCAGDERPDLQRSQACLPVTSTPSNEVAFAVDETLLAFECRSNYTQDGSLAEVGAQDPVTVVATAGGSVASSSLPLPSSYNVDEDDPPIIAKTKALAKAAFADGRFVEDIENGQSAARASLNNAERFGRCYLRGSWVKGQPGGPSAMTPPAPVPEEAVPQGPASTTGQWRTGGVWAWLGYGREVAGDR